MANDLVNHEFMRGKLSALYNQLIGDIVTIGEAETIARQAETLRHLAKTARLGEEWQNQFFKLRITAMALWARLWKDAQHNKGGRPTDNPSTETRGSPPTLDELGVTYDFSSLAQSLYRGWKFVEGYYKKADKEGWEYAVKGSKGILDHLGWEASREASAQENKKRREATIKEAEAAARRPTQAARPAQTHTRSETTHSPKVEPRTEPEVEPPAAEVEPPAAEAEQELPKIEIPAELLVKVKPPEPPPEMPKPPHLATAERVKALLRTAFDPAGNPHEKETARRAIEKADPRLATLEGEDNQRTLEYMRLCMTINTNARDQANRYYKLFETAQAKLREFQKIQDLIEKYEKRDRERLRIIRELKAENDKLKAELETLKRSATTPDPNHKTVH